MLNRPLKDKFVIATKLLYKADTQSKFLYFCKHYFVYNYILTQKYQQHEFAYSKKNITKTNEMLDWTISCSRYKGDKKLTVNCNKKHFTLKKGEVVLYKTFYSNQYTNPFFICRSLRNSKKKFL